MDDKWISVNDRLPEVGQSDIQCFGGYNKNCYYLGRYTEYGFHGLYSADIIVAITHWQPLPKAPINI